MKIRGFFSDNIHWKTISLALAALLWFFVINIENPSQPKEIRELSINIKGINEVKNQGYIVQNEEELRETPVRMVVRGPRLELERLEANKEGLIDISLDLGSLTTTLSSGSDIVERQVKYNVNILSDNVVVESVKPEFVSVVFEKEEEIIASIEYNIYGDTNKDYMALEPIINPTEVRVSGPKSEVEKVDRVVVDIDIDNFSEDTLQYTLPVKILDAEGVEITTLQKSPQYVDVTLPIGKKKVVPIEPQFSGQLPEGYIRGNVIVTPQVVTIIGKSSIVDQIESIKLEKIALDNMTQSTTGKVSFLLPEGIAYIDPIENKAVVTVEVQEERSYEYTITIDNMEIEITGLDDTLEYKILDEELLVILSGTAENLLKFDPTDVKATIDFTNLVEGEYSVPIQLELMEGVRVVNTPLTVGVRLEMIEDEDEDEEATTLPEDEEVFLPEEDDELES